MRKTKSEQEKAILAEYNSFRPFSPCIEYKDHDGVVRLRKNFGPNEKMESLESYDSNGRLDGTQLEYYSDGKLKSSTPYRHDKLEGVERHLFSNGNLEHSITWRRDKKNGIEKRCYKNGKPFQTTPFKNDLEHGIVKMFAPAGWLSDITPYSFGKSEGTAISYNENGRILSEFLLVKGKGLEKFYYPNGMPRLTRPYYNHKFHGRIKNYYPTGQLEEITSYKKNEQHGECTYFDREGEALKREYFWHGKTVSKPVYWLKKNWPDITKLNFGQILKSWNRNSSDIICAATKEQIPEILPPFVPNRKLTAGSIN